MNCSTENTSPNTRWVQIVYSHGLLGHSDLLAALWRFPLEHVAVVGSGRGGVLGQRGAGAQL